MVHIINIDYKSAKNISFVAMWEELNSRNNGSSLFDVNISNWKLSDARLV